MKISQSMRIQHTLAAAIVGCLFVGMSSSAFAADAYPLFTNPGADTLSFGNTDAFAFGSFASNDGASFNGNDILVQTQNLGTGNDGAGISVPISNGENGYTETFDTDVTPNDTSNPDIDNATAANSVFTTIGNSTPPANPTPPNPVTGTPIPRLGLNNGNVLRYSMWLREDPNNPFIGATQIEPVLKFEFYKEALSTFQDTNGGVQTFFADKVWDQDQQGGDGIWVDINGDGSAIDAAAASEGRLKTITSTEWTLIEVSYEVDDQEWLGIDDDIYTVADIEEIRAVMFWGDFASTNLNGSLWIDNLLVEVFADAASVTANTNPNPTLSEVSEDADFDNDNDVDGADYLTWQRNFGEDGSEGGDADFSGLVDGADLTIVRDQYGSVPSLAAVSIPEPASAALLVLGLVCLNGRTRRSR